MGMDFYSNLMKIKHDGFFSSSQKSHKKLKSSIFLIKLGNDFFK
jgi:hypothetical protein